MRRKWILQGNVAATCSALDEGAGIGFELLLDPVSVLALVVKETMRVSIPGDYSHEKPNKMITKLTFCFRNVLTYLELGCLVPPDVVTLSSLEGFRDVAAKLDLVVALEFLAPCFFVCIFEMV